MEGGKKGRKEGRKEGRKRGGEEGRDGGMEGGRKAGKYFLEESNSLSFVMTNETWRSKTHTRFG